MELWGLPLPLSNTFFALPQVLWPKATVRRLMLPEDRLVKPVFDGNALYVKQGKVNRSACFPADWLRDCCSGNVAPGTAQGTGNVLQAHFPAGTSRRLLTRRRTGAAAVRLWRGKTGNARAQDRSRDCLWVR